MGRGGTMSLVLNLHAIDKLEMFLDVTPEKAAAAARGVQAHLADRCELAALASGNDRVRALLPPIAELLTPNANGDVQVVPVDVEGWRAGSRFLLFQERFKSALMTAGLSSSRAAVVTGALNEIADNAYQHADCSVAHASFEVHGRWWAFSVTDDGRGIPASVASAESGHSDLDALRLALTDGWSRTGDPLRGRGFTKVLKVLADRSCEIRIRSGGAAGSWAGPSPTAQSIHFQALIPRRGAHVRVTCLADA